jgi:hypothetical protein
MDHGTRRRWRRLCAATLGAMMTFAAAAIATPASAGPVDDLNGAVSGIVNETTNALGEATGGGSGGGGSGGGGVSPATGTAPQAPATSPAPTATAPAATASPSGYAPPLHGTEPHGEGSVAAVELAPDNGERPADSSPAEDAVVGSSRGGREDGRNKGQVVVLGLFGNALIAVETAEGESSSGPLGPVNEELLGSLCEASGGSLCLEVLGVHSETDEGESKNSFAVAKANVLGIEAGAAESEGNFERGADCDTATGRSSVANAGVAGTSIAAVGESTSTSSECDDGSSSQENDSRVVGVLGTGLPIPVVGCEDGTPDSALGILFPLADAICNADDSSEAPDSAGQAPAPYGVREALTVLVLTLEDSGLARVSVAPAESKVDRGEDDGGPGDDGPGDDGPGDEGPGDEGPGDDGPGDDGPGDDGPGDEGPGDGGDSGDDGPGDDGPGDDGPGDEGPGDGGDSGDDGGEQDAGGPEGDSGDGDAGPGGPGNGDGEGDPCPTAAQQAAMTTPVGGSQSGLEGLLLVAAGLIAGFWLAALAPRRPRRDRAS